MSDTKLDPKTLTAVVRENYPPPPPMAGWLGFYYDSDSDNGGAGWYCSGKVHADREDALCELASFLPFEGSALVEVGQAGALFGQSESEAKATRDLNRLPEPAATDVFATDRAIGVQAMNAEDVPAATEMPEAVRKVCHRLRHLAMTSAIACRIGDRDEFDEYADALESWWRTHAQPVANVANVGMTEELEVVLRLAAQHVEGWQQTYQSPEYRKQMLSAIAAVRAQATAPKKLEKVRSFLNLMGLYYKKADTDLPQKAHTQGSAWAEALAELDAFEGKP